MGKIIQEDLFISKNIFKDIRAIYDKIKEETKNKELEKIVADTGYKTPTIAKLLIDDNIEPFLPY